MNQTKPLYPSSSTASASSFPGVSIIIPTYNGRHLLERFLPSVLTAAANYETTTQASTEILVIDDASQDDTVQWLHQCYPKQVICLLQPANRGFSPTCNVGFRAARYPILWLLNNDIEVTPQALLPLVKHFTNPEVFAVGCRAYRLDAAQEHTTEVDGAGRVAEMVRGYWKVYQSYDLLPEYQRDRFGPLYTMMASGGYAAFDANKVNQLGGFEELLAPFYWEDAELCYRAWKRGWTVLYEPESLVYHQSSATIAHQFEPNSVNLIATRNRMIMHWIHLHNRWFWFLHLVMTGLLLVGDLVRGRFHYSRALAQLWARKKEILARRQTERAAAVRNDREVLALIQEVTSRPGIATFKNDREYQAFQLQWEEQGGRVSFGQMKNK